MTIRTYLRISQEDEKDILENQRRETWNAAWELGQSLPTVYEEEKPVSGGTMDRSAWNRLMHDLRSGDVVIFTRPSRMTRGGALSGLSILARLRGMGVGWRFTEYGVLNFDSDTPEFVKDIIMAIISALDGEYREDISRRTKASYARRKALAEANGDVLSWGRRGFLRHPAPARSHGRLLSLHRTPHPQFRCEDA